MANVNSL